MEALPTGLYEKLLDEELGEVLDRCPELRPILRTIDDEASPHTYSQFLSKLLVQSWG